MIPKSCYPILIKILIQILTKTIPRPYNLTFSNLLRGCTRRFLLVPVTRNDVHTLAAAKTNVVFGEDDLY